MATSFYEVVVLGDELTGAVAAAHLARRGLRVLVLCSLPVESDLLAGYPLPRSPLALTGLDTAALKRLSNELNLLQILRRRVTPNHPSYQLLLPDARIDVGPEELPRELSRELPAEAAAFEAHTSDCARTSALLEELLTREITLPPDGFWDRRDVKRIAAQLPPGSHGKDAIDPLAALPEGCTARLIDRLPALFAADLDDPQLLSQTRLADLHRRGTARLDGGREGLRALLLDRVRTYSGEVRHDVELRGLSMRRSRVTGITMGHREEQVGCGAVLWARPARELVEMLSGSPPRRLAQAASWKPRYYRYLLHLVVPLEALPDPLGDLSYAVHDLSAPLEGANAFAMHVTPGHGKYAVLSLTARCTDPGPTALAELRRELRAHVDALLPFVDQTLLAVWSPHDGLPPQLEGGAELPPVEALPMDPIWSFPPPRALGLAGVPHRTGLKHVYLASRQLLPGLGLEGELIAGWVASRLVATKLKRRTVTAADLLGS